LSGQFQTPETLPETTVRLVLDLPDGPHFLSAITGWLVELAQPCTWEENTGAVTPVEMAEAWEFVLDQWLLREECP